MSKLREALRKIRRGETGRQIGFGAVSTPRRRALLLGIIAESPAQVQDALGAGAELVLITGTDPAAAAEAAKAAAGNTAVIGTRLAGLGMDEANTLREAGVDFVAAPLDTIVATAQVDGSPGIVGIIDPSIDDVELRSVALLDLDGALVDSPATGLSLAHQARLARIAVGASVPLLVACPADIAQEDLRVLRDAGVGAVLAPAATPRDQIAALAKRLESVQPRKAAEREIALLPAVEAHTHAADDDDYE